MPAMPSFHDGNLTGIVLSDGGAILRLRDYAGDEYELALVGLEALQVDDLREANIIYQLAVVTGGASQGQSAEDCLERLFPGPHANAAAEYHEAHATLLTAHLDRIRAGVVVLVVLTPSFGCDLVALCRATALRGTAEAQLP